MGSSGRAAALLEPLLTDRNGDTTASVDCSSDPTPLDGGVGGSGRGGGGSHRRARLGGAGLMGGLAFSWVSPLLRHGSRADQLHQRDLFDLPLGLQAAACGRRLWSLLHVHPSLLRAIASAYGRPYLALGLLKAAGDALNFAGPMLLNLLLRHLASRRSGGGGCAGESDGGGASLPLPGGWRLDVAAPGFGYACAVLLAASLVLKVLVYAGRCCF